MKNKPEELEQFAFNLKVGLADHRLAIKAYKN